MAHALWGHDGKCANLHGHSYRLEVTLIGEAQKEKGPKLGMIIDFADFKTIVQEKILSVFDHALVLYEKDERHYHFSQGDKLLVVDYQPTSENLLLDMVARLKKPLESYAKLYSLVLYETATNAAAWYADDQD